MQNTLTIPRQDPSPPSNPKPRSTVISEEKAKWHRCQNFKVLLQNRLKDKAKIKKHHSDTLPKTNLKNSKKSAEEKIGLAKKLYPNLCTEIPASAPTPCALKEGEMGTIIEAQATSMPREEINKLIKKMTLGFSVQKNESSFFLSEGIFAGASFHLTAENNTLSMDVEHGSLRANQVLRDHEGYLQKKLEQHEINLKGIAFL